MLCFTRATHSKMDVFAFKSNFIRSIFAESPAEWIHKMKDSNLDVFNNNTLLLLFDGQGQKSLFVIIGARYIRDYSKIGFQKNRPCIIHLDPNRRSIRKHDSRQIADKLRTWLNRLWQNQNNEYDEMLMPFQKRTMPLSRPLGMYHLVLSILSSF